MVNRHERTLEIAGNLSRGPHARVGQFADRIG